VVIDRDEFETKLAAASGAADLAANFVHDALNQGAEKVLGPALDLDRAQATRRAAARGAATDRSRRRRLRSTG
jgi:hypothetical protein